MASKLSGASLTEWAVKTHQRFNFGGNLSPEQVFQLSKEQVEALFDQESAKVQITGQRVLKEKSSKEDGISQKRLDFIEHVYNQKVAAQQSADKAEETRQLKARAKEALVKRKGEALDELSEEELLKIIDG